jgi:hypothetical protein
MQPMYYIGLDVIQRYNDTSPKNRSVGLFLLRQASIFTRSSHFVGGSSHP